MNYVIAFALCVSLTVLTALGGGHDWQPLAMSDMNVGIFLFIAWCFDKHRPRRR